MFLNYNKINNIFQIENFNNQKLKTMLIKNDILERIQKLNTVNKQTKLFNL